ncbi:hypothetical protein ES695_02470 [Candidatus Atribacteria bacterium 1244-E10-H5-B2]|nr:MAG: hypothetical protein ES695_02470 [Candidatus Atribacteria bacterium 1244-E10-H5-B2]
MWDLRLYNKKMIRIKHKKLDLEYTFTWCIKNNKYVVVRNKYINGKYAPGGWSEFRVLNLERLQRLVFNTFNYHTYFIQAF